VQDPLKQGLKHDMLSIFCTFFKPVEVQDPLKQGLKRWNK